MLTLSDFFEKQATLVRSSNVLSLHLLLVFPATSIHRKIQYRQDTLSWLVYLTMTPFFSNNLSLEKKMMTFSDICFKTSYLIKEFNCTEPSPFISVPWYIHPLQNTISQRHATVTGISYYDPFLSDDLSLEKKWWPYQTFFQNSYLTEEFNCTEPSPFGSVPWYIHPSQNTISQRHPTVIGISYYDPLSQWWSQPRKKWWPYQTFFAKKVLKPFSFLKMPYFTLIRPG